MPTRSRRPTPRPRALALIRTKLERPVARPEFVERPRLLDRLDEALEHRVTLLSAPPGFGKTTLVAQWLEQRRPYSDQQTPRYWPGSFPESSSFVVLGWSWLVSDPSVDRATNL